MLKGTFFACRHGHNQIMKRGNSMKLSKADFTAVENNDSDFLNNKGAKLYREENYQSAVEYYRLASSMGNLNALSNLAYCYMYARSIEKNMDLAMAYFRLAADRGSVDANYKLGSIYKNGEEGILPDNELCLYYYVRALQLIGQNDLNPSDYPSLHFSVAKELMPGGLMAADLNAAYQFLKTAKEGYETALAEGSEFYREAYESVLDLLEDPVFYPIAQANTEPKLN